VEILHAFLLTVWVGIGEDKRKVSDDMYFRNINDCVYYAQRLHKQGQKVTAYCLPVVVNDKTKVY
tara:strand:- start:1568 stop:1762 length:195 start_codon:yes stop_codon:yes gene_type:complete